MSLTLEVVMYVVREGGAVEELRSTAADLLREHESAGQLRERHSSVGELAARHAQRIHVRLLVVTLQVLEENLDYFITTTVQQQQLLNRCDLLIFRYLSQNFQNI